MLRFELTDANRTPLPPIDLDDAEIILGSGPKAQIRLPAAIAADTHVRLANRHWNALGEVRVDGTPRHAGDSGPLPDRCVLELAGYTIVIAEAPVGIPASGPQRTDSLARELVRSLLGDGGLPTFELEQGPQAGTTRPLAPPISTLVIGRGDEAGWVIVDEDLSRAHAEVRRDWDGVRVFDRNSKNGTRVDGAPVEAEGSLIRDGSLLELGSVQLRFRDPAERHLRGELPLPDLAIRIPRPSIPPTLRKRRSIPPPIAAATTPGRSLTFWLALALAGAALGAALWIMLG